MQPLPPYVQACVDELVALAPPLTEEQQRIIRHALTRRPQAPAQDARAA
jgi:hypothetical protein